MFNIALKKEKVLKVFIIFSIILKIKQILYIYILIYGQIQSSILKHYSNIWYQCYTNYLISNYQE